MPDQATQDEYAAIADAPVEPRIFYLSFVDPDRPEGDRWVGGCYVEADNVPNAITAAWTHGCNPGGAVKLTDLPPEAAAEIPEEQIGVLLDREALGETQAWA